MKKTWWCVVVLAVGLLVGAPVAQGQQPATAGLTAAELKKNFARISSGTEGESDAFDNLTATTARRLVTYLKSHELTATEAKAMGLDYSESTDAGHLKVFTH